MMQTRQKIKTDGSSLNLHGKDIPDFTYSRENHHLIANSQELPNSDNVYMQAENSDYNGYEDIKPKARYGKTNNPKRVTNKRPGTKPQKSGNRKMAKEYFETVEFKDVVQGFMDFIDEINKMRKKKNKKPKKSTLEQKLQKIGYEPSDVRKRIKYDHDNYAPRSFENGRMEFDNGHPNSDHYKLEKNGLYRFKDDMIGGKDLLEFFKKDDENPNHPNPQMWNSDNYDYKFKEQLLKNDIKGGYGQGMDYNHFEMNSKYFAKNEQPDVNSLMQRQANKYLFENGSNKFKDMLEKFQMPNMNELINQNTYTANTTSKQFQPIPDSNSPLAAEGLPKFHMMKQSNDIMTLQSMIENLFNKGNPNQLLKMSQMNDMRNGVPPSNEVSREFANMLNNFIPNAPTNIMHNNGNAYESHEPEITTLEKKMKTPFKRAATHVAIAYFIYLKSTDCNSLSKMDKSKMDPTYNARILKEKKIYATMGDENYPKNYYAEYEVRGDDEDTAELQAMNGLYEQYQQQQGQCQHGQLQPQDLKIQQQLHVPQPESMEEEAEEQADPVAEEEEEEEVEKVEEEAETSAQEDKDNVEAKEEKIEEELVEPETAATNEEHPLPQSSPVKEEITKFDTNAKEEEEEVEVINVNQATPVKEIEPKAEPQAVDSFIESEVKSRNYGSAEKRSPLPEPKFSEDKISGDAVGSNGALNKGMTTEKSESSLTDRSDSKKRNPRKKGNVKKQESSDNNTEESGNCLKIKLKRDDNNKYEHKHLENGELAFAINRMKEV
jgi:hypothetical protein